MVLSMKSYNKKPYFLQILLSISFLLIVNAVSFEQIHSWRVWEEEAHMDRHDSLTGELVNN